MTMYIPPIDDEHLARRLFGTLKPIWAVKKGDGPDNTLSGAYLKWAKDAYNIGMESNAPRAQTQLSNNLLYQSVQYLTGHHTHHSHGDETEPLHTVDPKQFKELIVNEYYDTVQQRGSKLSRFNITTKATPYSTDHTDREGSEVVQNIFKTIKYRNNMRKTYRDMMEQATIMGYSYIMPWWDPDKGDLNPKWVQAKKALGNKKGKVKIDGEMFSFAPKRELRIGDIGYRRPLPWELVVDLKKCPDDVEWFMHPRFEHIERTKFDHPELAKDIKPNVDARQFNMETLYTEELEDHVLILEVFGRRTRYMPNGLYFKFTPDLPLIEPHESEYSRQDGSQWGDLPLEWLTDVDIQGKLYPMSTFQILGGLPDTENKLYTQMRKSLMLQAHPKMAIPRQGKIAFGNANDAVNVEYTAPFKPELLPMQAIPPESFKFVEMLNTKMTQLQGLQSISKGDIDSNIRSGKQISLLQELEAVRGSPMIQKKGELVVAVDRKTLAIIGKNYRDSEERMLHILGNDKKLLIESFNVSVLNKPYDVQLIQADAFSESPSARIQEIGELMQNPQMAGIYTPEQWADILDLGTPEKFHDDAKVAVLKAEWENERYVQGKTPPLPDDGDDHINHWKVHMTLLRSRSFLEFSDKMKEKLKVHIGDHEVKMAEHMRKQQNPFAQQAYGQNLALLSGWPAFYELPEETQPQRSQQQQPEQAPQVNGQAGAQQ